MTNLSPDAGATSASVRAWHGWWYLGMTAALSAIAVALILRGRDDKPHPVPPLGTQPDGVAHKMIRTLPQPVSLVATDITQPLYTIVPDEKDGAQVLRIRTHADGDELIVDALTGRLVAVRDSKGRTIAVPAPNITGIELPATGS